MEATKNPKKSSHLLRGEASEERAHQFLLNNGLVLVCRNYRCKQGELDLIMQEGKTLVIVEVRFRSTDKYGGALESITPAKQARIIAATEHYISSQKIDQAIRFDVVALSGNGRLEWVRNAF